MALLENDIKKMEVLTKNFNVHDNFGVFLCIISGRSWDSINKGIVKTKFTNTEVLVLNIILHIIKYNFYFFNLILNK